MPDQVSGSSIESTTLVSWDRLSCPTRLHSHAPVPSPFIIHPRARSLGIMRDPVTLSDGFTYERASIEKWINAGNTTSPVTNETLGQTHLFPSQVLKNMIRAWREEGAGAELVRQYKQSRSG